jgi:hypothetical protein
VREETIQQGRYFQRLAQSEFAGFAAILIEDGGLRVLEDRIPRRISGLELFLDFQGEVVGCVLGLPPPSGQSELVADSPIGHDSLAARVGRKLGYKRPASLFRGFVEKIMERGLQAQFVYYELILQMLDVLEIRLN